MFVPWPLAKGPLLKICMFKLFMDCMSAALSVSAYRLGKKMLALGCTRSTTMLGPY